jgi:signal transduction histidine kinase
MLPFSGYWFGRIGQVLHSIRFRITLWTLATLAIVLIAFSSFIFYSSEKGVLEQSLQSLDNRSRQMLVAYQMAMHEHGEHTTADISSITSLGDEVKQDGQTSVLIGSDGHILQSFGVINQNHLTQIATAWQAANVGPGELWYTHINSAPWYDFTEVGMLYLVRVIPVPPGYLLVMGAPMDPNAQLPRQLWTLILGSTGILLAVLLGGYWLAGRLIAPVQKITRTAQEISATDLNRRIHINTRDELGELANTFDRMLDRLQSAFDRQRQFTADASHELRTPLTIVDLEAARALEHRRTPEDYQRALRVIQSENEFMTTLVNNLLTLARMDAGRAALKPDRIDLGDLALEVVERLEPLARKKGVELQAGDLPEVTVSGDRQYLIQMLSNLVENAIKYSRATDAKVCVETGTRQDGGSPAGWVRVEDNGPGIPAEAIPHLFDRFYRVDTARSHNPEDTTDSSEMGGSGLGLAIVDWIVHAHGGAIQVDSHLEQGTVFEVDLPLPEAKIFRRPIPE